MSFLAEMLAVVVIWLSAVALGQFGIVLDKCPQARPAAERLVSRSPREPLQRPAALIAPTTPPT
jgi:hypothetical protein